VWWRRRRRRRRGTVGLPGYNWSIVVKCGQIWSNMVKYGQIWSNVVKCGQIWSNMVKCGQIWSNVVKCGQMWSNMTKFSHKRWLLNCDLANLDGTRGFGGIHKLYMSRKRRGKLGGPTTTLTHYIDNFVEDHRIWLVVAL
jgi:hypothetical protein